jgi:hypothetical protein
MTTANDTRERTNVKITISKRTLLASAAAAGLVVSLGACSSDSTADKSQEFCTSAANLATQVNSLETMVKGGTATVDQIQDQKDKVKDAGEQAADDAKDLADSVKGNIGDADDAFQESVDDIPTDQTLKEAAPAYASAISAYNTALDSIKSEAGCS